MPVLGDGHDPTVMRSHQTTSGSLTPNGTYLLLSVAILITLGIRLQQRRQAERPLTESTLSITQKTIFSGAQTMQTPPSSSALQEKPFLPDLESATYNVDQQKVTLDQIETSRDSNNTTSRNSPQLAASQLASHSALSQTPFTEEHTLARSVSLHLLQPRRPGSLMHPEPPTPTIRLKDTSIKVQTQLPNKPVPEYHFQDLQPEYQAQYVHNEILFVPSPTEYVSFEALYSKFPPIYHEPNPTSYTSISASEISSTETGSYSTSSFSGSQDHSNHHHNPDRARRRSYTKTLSNGSEMSGEIVLSSIKGEVGGARQWRRHTRVFGGGICMACEESEGRRLSA